MADGMLAVAVDEDGKRKPRMNRVFVSVAGEGFEPSTFGL
jgi:hypothetical protein